VRILHKYLLQQNLALLCICLFASLGIYLLVDVFDRLDNFLEESAGPLLIGQYFLFKLPLILSQILPLVFFFALALQLGIMQRNRELTALEAGGISYQRLCAWFLVYAAIWAVLQLGFSQVLGVEGSRRSGEIWENLGRDDRGGDEVVRDVWYRRGDWILHLDAVMPGSDRVEGVRLIRVGEGFDRAKRMVRAGEGRISGGEWTLSGVLMQRPDRFRITDRERLTLDLGVDVKDLVSQKQKLDIREMTLWELGRAIGRLERTGANIEAMATLWHQKLAYACSLLVLAMVGLAASRTGQSTVTVICLGLLVGFVFYGVFVLGGQMGERGVLAPWLGGWLGVLLVGVPALLWLLAVLVGGRVKRLLERS
jgi:lipopolysaccharide export system permease protein